jgi:hypothetical protein
MYYKAWINISQKERLKVASEHHMTSCFMMRGAVDKYQSK